MHPTGSVLGALSDWLFPRVRAQVLARLLLNSREWHARELARVLGLNHTAIAKELRGMASAGIAIARRSGNSIYYSANRACPIYLELRSTLVKTVGIADPIMTALSSIADRINLTYIYGSFADGTAGFDSDVDLMIVGQVSLFEVVGSLSEASMTIARSLNPTVFTASEYTEELKRKEGFVYSVHNGTKILLIGEIDETK